MDFKKIAKAAVAAAGAALPDHLISQKFNGEELVMDAAFFGNSLHSVGHEFSETDFAIFCAKLIEYYKRPDLPPLSPQVRTLVDAIVERPQDMTGRISIQAMLVNHRDRAKQAADRLREKLAYVMDDTPPEVIFELEDGYRLTEAKTPKHLQAISAELGHCVGTLHNKTALEKAGLTEDNPGADYYLQYAIQIRKGESRIFSLEENGVPQATIEYDVKQQRIAQIEGRETDYGEALIEAGSEVFYPLCEALYQLTERLPVDSIDGLPEREGQILFNDGTWISSDLLGAKAAHLVLTGTVRVTKTRSTADLALLCAVPRLKLEISNPADLERLPEEVCAIIECNNVQDIHIPRLRKARHIFAFRANSFSLPQLEEAGDILADQANSLDLPQLRRVNCVSANWAHILSLPQLISARAIVANAAAQIDLPQLGKVTDIMASYAILFCPKSARIGSCNVDIRSDTKEPAAQPPVRRQPPLSGPAV